MASTDASGAVKETKGFLRFATFEEIQDKMTIDLSSQSIFFSKLPCLRRGKEVEEWRESAAIEHLTPWFLSYRAYVTKYLLGSEHETFSHPVARLLVLSSAEADPIGTLKSMAAEPLPSIYSKGYTFYINLAIWIPICSLWSCSSMIPRMCCI